MHHGDTAATATLGLPGFVLLAVSEHDGEIEYAIETLESVTGCPSCGVLPWLHDRRRTDVRDLPSAGRPVTLVWLKRVWCCVEGECPRQTWSESSEHIRPRPSLTERARRKTCRRVGQDGETAARIAAQYGRPLVDDPARLDGVRQLGVDETASLSTNGRHPTIFATGVVDLTGPTTRLLDVMLGRAGNPVQLGIAA